MRTRALAIGLLAAAAAGGGAVAAHGDPAKPATLSVTARQKHVPMFVEGYVIKLRITRGDAVILRREIPGGHRHLLRNFELDAGHYKVESALHSCDGNCSALDRAWSRCSMRLPVQGGEAIGIQIMERHPRCRMLGSVGVPSG
jgi:hypothetical protein